MTEETAAMELRRCLSTSNHLVCRHKFSNPNLYNPIHLGIIFSSTTMELVKLPGPSHKNQNRTTKSPHKKMAQTLSINISRPNSSHFKMWTWFRNCTINNREFNKILTNCFFNNSKCSNSKVFKILVQIANPLARQPRLIHTHIQYLQTRRVRTA
jgi:preprotein translocase subunit Sec63